MLYRGVVVVRVQNCPERCPAAGCKLYAFEHQTTAVMQHLEAFGEEWQREQPLKLLKSANKRVLLLELRNRSSVSMHASRRCAFTSHPAFGLKERAGRLI